MSKKILALLLGLTLCLSLAACGRQQRHRREHGRFCGER